MKTYIKPQTRGINLDFENLIATSAGASIEYSENYADNNVEALSNKKSNIWEDESNIWK